MTGSNEATTREDDIIKGGSPTPLEAAYAIMPLLLNIKSLMIMSLEHDVIPNMLQTNFETALLEISKLAPFTEYEGVAFLSSINVLDAVSTEAQLEQLDAELTSLIELIADLHKFDEDQTISGTRDDDEITTGGGDDTVEAGRGDDVVDTGDGDDDVNGGRGDDFVFGRAGDDDLYGDRGNDFIDGGNGDDRVLGGRGDDALTGGSGDDIVMGGRGADAVFGDLGDDYLSGGLGDDALDGGKGDDVLKGGSGADVFVFEGDMGHDIIKDFNIGEDDHLVFIFHDDAFRDWTAQSILNASIQAGRDVIIDIAGTGDRVTLVDTDLTTLSTADIDVFWYA